VLVSANAVGMPSDRHATHAAIILVFVLDISPQYSRKIVFLTVSSHHSLFPSDIRKRRRGATP
jgi:hypothetical protein